MKQVTRLVVQQKDKERVNVYLDGEFAFGLALLEAARLRVGQMLSDEQVAALRDEDGYHRAYSRALDLLSRRPRSQREVERYLTEKEVPPLHQERVLTRLAEAGLLDDLVFARYWIDNREAFRPRGAQAIRWELRQKGLSATIIDEALGLSELDEAESAFRVARKLLPRLRAIPDQRLFQQKLASHLARRGFGWDAIRQASDRLWAARDEATQDEDDFWVEG